MQDRRFDRSVRVLTGRHFSVTVATVAQAADYLMNKWPAGVAGPRHLQARLTCMAALEGLQDAGAAREAFEEAADEARILVKRNGQT